MLPILKWTGGKRKLTNKIQEFFPQNYNNYWEPFCGGAALFFALELETNAIINDSNEELINFYNMIANDYQSVIELLDTFENSQEFFSEIRAWDRNDEWKKRTAIMRAARFLYLNKTAYSGLWRVNQKNQMNVPYGNYANPKFYNVEEIHRASELLKENKIFCKNFLEMKPEKNDLVYLDPPYIPISATSNFTSYTKDGFGNNEQALLADYCYELDEREIYFILSNSYTPIIFELYEGFDIYDVIASRSINAGWDNKNSKVKEVIVTNI